LSRVRIACSVVLGLEVFALRVFNPHDFAVVRLLQWHLCTPAARGAAVGGTVALVGRQSIQVTDRDVGSSLGHLRKRTAQNYLRWRSVVRAGHRAACAAQRRREMCGPSWPAPRAAREASCAALRCPLRHLTAMDGGNAENAGAFFGLPAQSNVTFLRKVTFSSTSHPRKKKKGPRGALFHFWWRRRESNPRPKVLRPRIYMHSSPFSLVLRQHDVRSAPQDQPVRS